jgi:hypothetical protein
MANLKCYCDICLEGLRKITQTLVRIAGVQAEIRTKCLPDKSQKWYRLRQLSCCRLSVKKKWILFIFSGKSVTEWETTSRHFSLRTESALKRYATCMGGLERFPWRSICCQSLTARGCVYNDHKSPPESCSVLCPWTTIFGKMGLKELQRVLERNTFWNLTLTSKVNLLKYAEIAQHNAENQRSASSHFPPKVETEHSIAQTTNCLQRERERERERAFCIGYWETCRLEY